MSTLLAWVLAASSLLAPNRSHDRLAEAIATRAEAEPPLFKEDEDRRKTMALLVAVAFRESSLRHDAVGDHVKGKPTSFCAFQIHLPAGRKTAEGWTGEDLLEDPNKCVTAAYRMLRISVRKCPDHPIAWYAEGPGGCASRRAQRISRDRVLLARRLVKKVEVEEKPRATTPARDGTKEATMRKSSARIVAVRPAAR
jgi:hypothetical protein